MILCLMGFCRPQILYARNAEVERHEARLTCGGTHFYARTEFIRDVAISQVVTARLQRPGPARQVDLRQSRISYPYELGAAKGLASFVAGWQCRKTPTGHVLVLWTICPKDLSEGVPQEFCSLTGEWERYIALDGSLLDQGFSFDDTRYDALRLKLGYHDKPDEAGDDGPFIWIH